MAEIKAGDKIRFKLIKEYAPESRNGDVRVNGALDLKAAYVGSTVCVYTWESKSGATGEQHMTRVDWDQQIELKPVKFEVGRWYQHSTEPDNRVFECIFVDDDVALMRMGEGTDMVPYDYKPLATLHRKFYTEVSADHEW